MCAPYTGIHIEDAWRERLCNEQVVCPAYSGHVRVALRHIFETRFVADDQATINGCVKGRTRVTVICTTGTGGGYLSNMYNLSTPNHCP